MLINLVTTTATSTTTAMRTRASRSNFGFVTIPLATIIAIGLLPTDPSAPGSLFWSAWAMTLGLLGGLINDLFAKGPTSLLRAQHLVILALVGINYGEVLQPWYTTGLTTELVAKNFTAIGL